MRYNKLKYGVNKPYETPVFVDYRAPTDIERAKEINTKIAATGWGSLTSAEITEYYTGIGALRASDLNRIEFRCAETKDMLQTIGYDSLNIAIKSGWTRSSIPRYESDMERLRDNIDTMLTAYNHEIGQPEIGHSVAPDYMDINELEQGLKLLDKNMKDIAHQWYQYAGVTYANGVIL